MPMDPAALWGALLCACPTHGDTDRDSGRLLRLQPKFQTVVEVVAEGEEATEVRKSAKPCWDCRGCGIVMVENLV